MEATGGPLALCYFGPPPAARRGGSFPSLCCCLQDSPPPLRSLITFIISAPLNSAPAHDLRSRVINDSPLVLTPRTPHSCASIFYKNKHETSFSPFCRDARESNHRWNSRFIKIFGFHLVLTACANEDSVGGRI